MKPYVFIFDIGNVMLDFDLPGLQTRIAAASQADLACVQREWHHPDFIAVESGKLDSKAYYERFSSRIGLSWTFDRYKQEWADIFSINSLGRGLYLALHQSGRPVAVLSNLAAHHVEAIERNDPDFFHVGNHHFLSFELGLHKPNPEIFLSVSQRLGVPVSCCVFLDDRIENVRGAQAVGMHARQFRSDQSDAVTQFIGSFM